MKFRNITMSDPPLYNSFEETAANCVFCKCATDDRILYGDKFTIDTLTFHHFCLVSFDVAVDM